MNIKVLRDSELSKREKDNLIQFVADCFEKDEPEKRRTIFFSPIFRHLLLFLDKELISYVKIIKRKTKFQGKNIIIGGIGALSTKYNHRNRGHATKLLKEAMKILREEKADFGLLQTDPEKGENLYKRFGFFFANKSYTFKDIYDKLHTTKSGAVMMARINSQDILDEILSAEELFNIGDGDW